jgi:predicted exporter
MWWLFRLLLGTVLTIGLIRLFHVDVLDSVGLVLASAVGYGISFLAISLFKRNERKRYAVPAAAH